MHHMSESSHPQCAVVVSTQAYQPDPLGCMSELFAQVINPTLAFLLSYSCITCQKVVIPCNCGQHSKQISTILWDVCWSPLPR